MYVGHIKIKKAGKPKDYPNFDPNLTMVVTSATTELRLQHVSDPTKYFLIYLRLPVVGGTTNTFYVYNSPSTFSLNVSSTTDMDINLNILSPGGSDVGYQGTYTTYFRYNLYADYGTPDQVLVSDMVMNLMMYYIAPTSLPPGETVVTNLYLTRYPSADNIDLPAMQLNQSSLTVGTVDFQSNDSSSSSSYSLGIEPCPDALGSFTFTKSTGNALPIPYKVHLTGRTSPATSAFTTAVPSKGPAGYWQDWIELAISGMNYTAVPVTAGTYTSVIRINLISN